MEWQSVIPAYYKKVLLLFGQCDLCGNRTSHHQLLCHCCLDELPLFRQEIVQGDLLNWPAINKALPRRAFDQLFCLSPYLPPFNSWLTELKYRGRFEIASLLADLLVKQWQLIHGNNAGNNVDLVINVPLHSQKWKTRGYNQAHLIAKKFAKQLQLPYQPSAVLRVTENTSQVGNTGAERRKNLAGAFALSEPLSPLIKHVMIVDDVITTGTTANEIAKLLKKSGVESVTVVTACLTLPKT